MAKPVLLDTGGIVALLDRSERHHEQCVDIVSGLTAPLVTCEAVITESCYLLRNLRGAPQYVLENVERGVFRIPFALSPAAARVRTLLSTYASVPMDLADACLVRLAEELGTGVIISLDTDFRIYRWRRTRPFHNLVDL